MAKIILKWDQVFSKGAILAGSKPWYEYKDGKRADKPSGLTYILINRLGYEPVNVKISSMTPIISNEEIEASETDIRVEAEGFEGVVYNNNGKISISGKAERLVILS